MAAKPYVRPYVYQAFPAWWYHASEKPKLVRSPEELEALGSEWHDTPAPWNLPEVEDGPTQDARQLELYAESVFSVIEGVNRMDDEDLLKQVQTWELANPKYSGGRKMVLKAIEERIAALA